MRHPVRLAVQEQYLQGDTMTAKWQHAQRLGFDAIELRGAGTAGSRPGCPSCARRRPPAYRCRRCAWR